MLFLSTSKPANTSYSRGTNVLSLIGAPPSDNAFCSRHCTRALVSRTDIPHTSLRTGDDLQAAAAVRAVFHIDIEDPFEQPGPTQARRRALRVIACGLGSLLWRTGAVTPRGWLSTSRTRKRRQLQIRASARA